MILRVFEIIIFYYCLRLLLLFAEIVTKNQIGNDVRIKLSAAYAA